MARLPPTKPWADGERSAPEGRDAGRRSRRLSMIIKPTSLGVFDGTTFGGSDDSSHCGSRCDPLMSAHETCSSWHGHVASIRSSAAGHQPRALDDMGRHNRRVVLRSSIVANTQTV
jgi:hypothetical protein